MRLKSNFVWLSRFMIKAVSVVCYSSHSLLLLFRFLSLLSLSSISWSLSSYMPRVFPIFFFSLVVLANKFIAIQHTCVAQLYFPHRKLCNKFVPLHAIHALQHNIINVFYSQTTAEWKENKSKRMEAKFKKKIVWHYKNICMVEALTSMKERLHY